MEFSTISAELGERERETRRESSLREGRGEVLWLITTAVAWKEGGDWVKVGLNGIRDLDNYRFDTLLEDSLHTRKTVHCSDKRSALKKRDPEMFLWG